MALRYKVPQNVQREDQILFFITMKQLVILMVTGGFSYLLFINLSKVYILDQVSIALICLPFVLGVAFCFVKIKGIGLPQFVLLTLEAIMLPGRRYWQEGSGPVVSSTHNFSTKKEDDTPVVEAKDVSQEKIKNLAELIDSGGRDARSNA